MITTHQLPDLKFQIQHLEKIGIEVEKYFIKNRQRKVRHFQRINPIDRLLVTKQQASSAKQYQEDYELANLANHARMSYSQRVAGGKIEEREIKEAQIIAAKNVSAIRELLLDREIKYNQFCEKNGSRKRSKRYLLILNLFFEIGIKLSNVSLILGYSARNQQSIEKKVIEIIEIMDNYYNN